MVRKVNGELDVQTTQEKYSPLNEAFRTLYQKLAWRLPFSGRLFTLALILGGFFLRVYRLGNRSVWWDEGYTGWLARQPLGAIATTTAHDVHPPLYYWLLSGWRLLSGDSEFGLRFFSAIIGLLTVAAVYQLGRVIGGRKVALLAALFLAISRFHISWSQEIRMYILAALWAALALWATVRYWKKPALLYGLLYILFIVAGLHTLYLFVLVLVITNLATLYWLWREKLSRLAVLSWITLQAGVLILYLPWLFYALNRIRSASTASPLRYLDFIKIYWTILTTGIPVAVEEYWPYTIAVLLVALISILVLALRTRGHGRRESVVLLLLLGVLFPAAAVYLISLPRQTFFYAPQIAPRYLIILIAAYVALLAYGLAELTKSRRLLGLLSIIIVLLTGVVGLRTYHPGRVIHDDYQSLVSTINNFHRPGDAVVLVTDRDWPIFAFHFMDEWAGVPDSWAITPESVDNFLNDRWLNHQGIWLVSTQYSAQADPQGLFSAWLNTRALEAVNYDFGDKQLAFFPRTQDRASTIGQVVDSSRAQSLNIISPSGLKLFAYHVPVPEYESGDTVVLSLFWQGQGREKVTAGFMDKEQQVVKSITEDLTGTGTPVRQQLNLVVPPEAPSGKYTFFVRFDSGPLQPIGEMTLRQRQRRILAAEDVQIDYPTSYTFANGARLLGFDLDQSVVKAGDAVALTLYWQTGQQLEERYKVFVHIQGTQFNTEGTLLWGQQDNEPVNNSRPLTQWQIGEVIVDPYNIRINELAPPGEYSLNTGLYHPISGERLLVSGADQAQSDHITLATITVATQD